LGRLGSSLALPDGKHRLSFSVAGALGEHLGPELASSIVVGARGR
jgi:hypothetical protein